VRPSSSARTTGSSGSPSTSPTPPSRSSRRTARGVVRTLTARREAAAAEERRRWRSLLLAIKAKFELVETGITSFEEEFAVHIVLPDGRRVGEHLIPAIATAYEQGTMPALLPGAAS
jgi:hypothetical protein